jgi:hypothetical protein
VEASATPRIQEAHATVIHILCELVEAGLFGEGNGRPVSTGREGTGQGTETKAI